MGARDDHMMAAVQQYPCPWCSQDLGFRPGPAKVSDWLSSAARALVQLTKPATALQVAFSPGMLAHCRGCKRPVGICGHCDHPNRDAGINVTCSNCKKMYRPG
jgi:hypothetical protein